MKVDIHNRKDIELLVRIFYDRVRLDSDLAPFFSHVDWEKHLPVMQSFWASMILGEQSYRGNPFASHIGRSIDAPHFHMWLGLFTAVVDEHFAGERAEEIKMRATAIAGVFQHKLGLNDQTEK